MDDIEIIVNDCVRGLRKMNESSKGKGVSRSSHTGKESEPSLLTRSLAISYMNSRRASSVSAVFENIQAAALQLHLLTVHVSFE